MEHTLAAVFDDRSAAQQAMDALVRGGCSKEQITLKDSGDYGMQTPLTDENIHSEGFGESVRHFFRDLFGTGHSDSEVYSEAVSRGKCVLTLESDDQDEVERAAAIVEGYGPIDIEEHERRWRAGGWAGAAATRTSGAWQQAASMQKVEPDTGAARTVPPGQGSVQGVQGDRQGSMQRADLAGDTGMRAPPVGMDQPRLGERLIDRGGVRTYQRLTESPAEETYYRSHWSSKLSKAGGKYEDYAPAYRYGSSMADSDSYRGRNWDEVEPELRSRWESSNPGSAWEKFKAAVRHGWDRITS